ncbi:hypothetical protein [Leptolyngbya sp. BC1307]|uniref:tetratricopeptide repeat protein n=1 Tax=Leptolyngbya sp. BC1307 TaxID=2029589 RepID=UPI000EFCCCAD|nr:hypothetical protein [Leptolyngbya sp. BC1307]
MLDSIVPSIQSSPQYPLEANYSRIEAAQIYHRLDSRQAIEVSAQARTSSAQLSDSQMLPLAQAALVRGYAEVGEFDQALVLAKSIDNVSQRQVAYGAIATAYARAGLPGEADSLVKSIGNPQFARADMLRAYLETEQYVQAEQVAQQPNMIEFLPEVGRTYCKAGRLEKAVTLIDQNPVEDWLRECVATEFAKQGEFERALALVQPIEAPDDKAEALTQIAVQYANPAADSRWQRFWQRWFGGDRLEPAAEILDQALSLIQPKT